MLSAWISKDLNVGLKVVTLHRVLAGPFTEPVSFLDPGSPKDQTCLRYAVRVREGASGFDAVRTREAAFHGTVDDVRLARSSVSWRQRAHKGARTPGRSKRIS